MQVFLVLSKEQNGCRDKRARQFTKRRSKYKKNASSHVPIFNNEHVFFFLYSARIVNFCLRTSNAKWKISIFYAFGWINGVASFCEVNPSMSRCYKPRKKYIKFVVLYTNSFFWSPKWIWKNTRKFFPGNFCFFFAVISLVTATCSKRGCKNHRNHGVILLEQTVSFQLVISPFKTN